MGDGGRISWGRLILGGLLALVVAAALLVLIGPLVAMRFTGGDHMQIQGDAMAPVLLPGDWVLSEALTRGQAPPRGAIVVYEHPQNRGENHIMRVIGLPGDRIQVKGGILHINGTALPTVRAGDFIEPKVRRGSPPGRPRCINEPVPSGGACAKEHWRETLPGGRVHSVLNLNGIIVDTSAPLYSGADNTSEFTVPEEYLFFMGDNRDNSVDSRFPQIGMVPFENLIGRAEVIALSADGAFWQFWNWRGDRFFKSIE